MAPADSAHSTEKMLQIARSMHTELEKLRSSAGGHSAGVGAIGSWDVPQQLSARVSDAHEAMVGHIARFVVAYEDFIRRIESAAKDFDLSNQASVHSSERAAGLLGPRATYESQN